MAGVKRGADLDGLIEEITVDAYGDEGYWAFLTAFQDEVPLPARATIVGVAVEVTKIDFDGNERRGLTAVVRRKGHRSQVALVDVVFPKGSQAACYLAAYRRWLGDDGGSTGRRGS